MHDVVPAEKSFTKVTLPLGSSAARLVGSSPTTRTKTKGHPKGCPFVLGSAAQEGGSTLRD